MKCPGCGVMLYIHAREGLTELPNHVTHTPERCRTASGYAALVEAARGVEAGWFGGEDYATVGHRMDALRTTLGALR